MKLFCQHHSLFFSFVNQVLPLLPQDTVCVTICLILCDSLTLLLIQPHTCTRVYTHLLNSLQLWYLEEPLKPQCLLQVQVGGYDWCGQLPQL